MIALLLLAVADDPALAERMRPLYLQDAAAYTIAVETAPDRSCELKKEPVFEWSNPTREGVQQGAVFLWTRAGRPAALGSVFSHPDDRYPGRRVCHEFHALDPERLVVTRPKEALNQWEPKAGLPRTPLADAAPPAATAAARLLQLRQLAGQFAGHSLDDKGNRLELRLLPTPLYRYPEAKTGVIDGALFVLVSEAGTDPEVLLLLEASADGWRFAGGRFSDRSLRLHRKGQEVWSSVRGPDNVFTHDRDHLFRFYPDSIRNADGKVIVRIRAAARWDFIRVTDR